MQQVGVYLKKATRPNQVPLPLRFLGKLVVDVLPAALASVIGAFLFAQYQFGRPAEPAAAAAPAIAAAPASSEMLQVVREEHAMIREFLAAQQAEEKSRIAAADAADARAAADAKLVESAAQRAAVALSAEKPPTRRGKPAVIAAAPTAGTSTAVAGSAPLLIATAQQDASLTPPAPPPPAPADVSLVRRTLAVPGHVVSMTLHAVMAIGGIPSWIGHRVGAGNLDTDALPAGTAS
jgi:hypothetical protein